MSNQFRNLLLPPFSQARPGASAHVAEANDASMHRDRLLDDALAASFPCSDPVATLSVAGPTGSERD
jgi:hypothetical protein